MKTTARRDGDNIIVTIPMDEVQALRVALQPCQCKHVKSIATAELRAAFVKGLGRAMDIKRRPMSGA
ncbi:MAG: hypothetical protein ABJG14_21955 [Sulfitobacter sp.]|uniref:hypothetical protein n=1 Tax=Alphaproteobacteria TaxID=28211 RepID=UPI0032640A4D